MNRKSLEKYTGHDNYNPHLFASSLKLTQTFQKIMIKTDELSDTDRKLMLEKEKKLEIAIKNAIGAFGKFADIKKTPLATPLDYSVDIFEAISDNIQTSVQKYRENHKKGGDLKAKPEKSGKEMAQRPQDKNKDIKPTKF